MQPRFAAPLESEFQRDYARKTLPAVRSALLLVALLLAAFAMLAWLPEKRESILRIRFLPAVAILLGVFAWSFHSSFRNRISWVLALVFASAAALLFLASRETVIPFFAGTTFLYGSAFLGALVVPHVLESFARRDFARNRELRDLKSSDELKTRALNEALAALERAQTDVVQSERMAGLGSLVSGFVHELASPLSVIRAGADLSETAVTRLEGSSEPPPKRLTDALLGAHRASLQATERISAILKSLRNFSRLDPSRLDRVDLHEGIEDALTLLAPKLPAGITLRRKFGDIPKVVCQPAELNQVFLRLLSNAARAIGAAGTLTIETWSEEDVVCVRVTDDGCGIDPDVMQLLFLPRFRRAEPSAEAGMGLFVSHQIVERHGGRILVASETGRGTAVTVKLPRDRSVV